MGNWIPNDPTLVAQILKSSRKDMTSIPATFLRVTVSLDLAQSDPLS